MTESTRASTADRARPSAGGDTAGEDRPRVGATADQAASAAAGIKDRSVEAAGDIKHRAGREVANLGGEARQQARTLAHDARDRIGGQADDATRRLASTISGAGNELRTMAERSDQPDGPVAGVARQLADRSDGLAQRLEARGYRGVADDLSRLGRNKPGLFLLAAGVAGFAVGRVLRNTDTRSLTEAVKGDTDTSAPDFAGSGYGDDVVLDSPSATYAPPVAVGDRPGSR